MYSGYQDREGLEDDLYQEDAGDSDGSEVNSELEFRLYSQLHYSANMEEMEEQEEDGDNRPPEQPVTNGKLESAAEVEPPSPPSDNSESPQTVKGKAERSDKRKKGIATPKAQKPSSSQFEEVIVIDSSPEVISLSEEDTDSGGVCDMKGRNSRQPQTSTPAQQKRKTDLSAPVAVVSSSSESDSEDSEDSESQSESSDSDGLENWMILGRGKQEEDQSISLNLEGANDSSADTDEEVRSWIVSDKDKEAQIFNKDKGSRLSVQRPSYRYYTGKNVHCRNCNKTGHLSKNCPDPKKVSPCFLCGVPGHLSSTCPNKHCNNCGLPGHLYDSCSERAYWHKRCHRCSMTGHFFDDCPEIWRQYHTTTKTGPPVKRQGEDNGRSPAYCYNCSRKGHFGHACTRPRMFNGTYASTPFINHYDTREDINRRQHRLKVKVKELKKNGFLPVGSMNLFPPEKPHRTPQQNRKNHAPGRSHIFFHEDGSASSKTKKHKKQGGGGGGGGKPAKPWKPKRPVPTSRETPAKLILDEADDFPRGGGGKEDFSETKRKRRRLNKEKAFLSEGHKANGRDGPRWKAAQERVKKKKKKNPASEMYPTDENLFIIKQRKRKR